jgi:LPXTG-motif cell wall-anchored protein
MKLMTLFFFLLSFSAQAKRFTNQYIEFELPAGWECSLEGTEWVCQSENEDRKKEAIIIMAAKIRGENDSLDEYQAYLNQKKTYALPGGSTQVSEPKYTKVININDQRWIDALHLASEIPGFYTRYMATVKEDLGVAVTFSVGKDLYATYQPIFDKIIESMRVFRQKQVNMDDLKSDKKGDLGDTEFIPDETGLELNKKTTAQKRKTDDNSSLWIIIGLAAVGGVLVFLRKNKKK